MKRTLAMLCGAVLVFATAPAEVRDRKPAELGLGM